MEYPTLNVKQNSRQMSDAFLGYNHNLRIGETEFYDMKNMTSDYYPVLAPRKKRGVYREDVQATGIIAKGKLCYVDGSEFVIGDDGYDMELFEGRKELISMGAYVIIMPDRKYINTVKPTDWGKIDAEYPYTGPVKFTMCTLTGENYSNAPATPTAPTDPEPKDGDLWIDTSSVPNTLKKYSESTGQWVSITTTYVKIESEGIANEFKQYDGVKISGLTGDLESLNGNHALWAASEKENYIIITGILNQVTTQTSAITVSRKMPTMDFIVESNNRLWGCRYGVNDEGEVVNELYASKLGDFKNWNCMMNLSTDSYRVSCGTDGKFTGAITHLGYPLFFKENCVHKVYGDYPANFRVQDTACRGVQRGSHRSLAIVNETLFYKSGNGVCAYDGSLPVEMSSALGEVRYIDAVACGQGNKYYIDMKTADGVYHLFVYDTAKGMWHKEDNIRLETLCEYNGEVYAVEHGKNRIVTLLGSGIADSEKVPWMVESGLIGMSMPDMKYVSRLMVRMSLEIGADVKVSIQYDSMGEWETVCIMKSSSLRTFSVPVRPKRCDHFRIRIEGEGDCRIYSITKTIEQGSDIS